MIFRSPSVICWQFADSSDMDLRCAPRSNSGVRSGSLTDSYYGTLWKYSEDGLLGDRCNVVIGSSPIYFSHGIMTMNGRAKKTILRGHYYHHGYENHLTGMILSNPIMILDINQSLPTGWWWSPYWYPNWDDPLQVGPSSGPRAIKAPKISQGTVGSTASLVRLAPQQQKLGVPYFPFYLPMVCKVCQYEVRYKSSQVFKDYLR